MYKQSDCCVADLIDRPCDFCASTGKDHNEDDCTICNGTGTEFKAECSECGEVK